MFRKTSQILTGALVFGSFLAASVVPAMAEPTTNNNKSSEMLIAQACGHETYQKGEQLKWSDFVVGTVVGQAGDIVTISLPDGTFFNTSMTDTLGSGVYNYYGGKDVLLQKNDNDTYTLVGFAHPRWITMLKGYNMEVSCETNVNISSLLQEIGTKPLVGLPELSASEPAPAAAPVPEFAGGIRGLW